MIFSTVRKFIRKNCCHNGHAIECTYSTFAYISNIKASEEVILKNN